jgi:hypothetical protein
VHGKSNVDRRPARRKIRCNDKRLDAMQHAMIYGMIAITSAIVAMAVALAT